MTKRKNDDAASTREDSFLAELIPQAAEYLAEQHAREFDAEAGKTRFLTWLAAHTKKLATTATARAAGGGWAGPVSRNDPAAVALASRAATGDQGAWDELVERYAPLIWSICRRYRLREADAEDVGQQVWLHLVNHLENLRDPAALPGWLATITRRECARVLRAGGPELLDPMPADSPQSADDLVTAEADLLAAERAAALREAVAELPPRCRQLLSMLNSDPPLPYAEISARLGISVASIGPQRARCLEKVRAIIARHDSETGADIPAGEPGHHSRTETG